MQFVNVSQLAERPLAGCSKWFVESCNSTILIRTLYLRLCLFTSIREAIEIYRAICDECDNDPEYVVNELQYEIRKASGKTSDGYESEIVSRWAEVKMRVSHINDVLEFVKQLKENRISRFIK